MKYKVIKEEDQKISEWSGGTTKEIYIYPEDSSYKERNFLFRVSSATVDVEKSEFTKLNGVNRILMAVSAPIKLCHKGHYDVELKKFEQDTFSGSWDTESYGKAADFNLMMKDGCTGTVNYIALNAESHDLIKLKPHNCMKNIMCLYNVSCELLIDINNETLILNKNECLLLEYDICDENNKIKITNNENALNNLIIADVCVSR